MSEPLNRILKILIFLAIFSAGYLIYDMRTGGHICIPEDTINMVGMPIMMVAALGAGYRVGKHERRNT